MTSSDLYPTCLAAAGQPLRPSQHRDGMNLQPLLEGENSLDREAIFWHFPHYNQHPSAVPSSVIRKGPWKLIETFDPVGVELYNLEADLSETTNLAAEQPELVAELRQQLNAWRDDVVRGRWSPIPTTIRSLTDKYFGQ